MLAVHWYLRYGLSYRDIEELLAERGIEMDHVTIHRWVQRFTPLLIDAEATTNSAQKPNTETSELQQKGASTTRNPHPARSDWIDLVSA